MKKPYVVLGVYNPPEWDAAKVCWDLMWLTNQKGLKVLNGPPHNLDDACAFYERRMHAGVRRRAAEHGQGEQWHQDGDTTHGSKMDQAIVLWCSNTPTQIKYNGTVYQPEPREVIVFRNLSCYHRRPPDANYVRWTYRQRCEIPTHIHLP